MVCKRSIGVVNGGLLESEQHRSIVAAERQDQQVPQASTGPFEPVPASPQATAAANARQVANPCARVARAFFQLL